MARHVVTAKSQQQVERLIAIGCTEQETAYVLGISLRTLQRRYRRQIEAGRARRAVSLRRRQWLAAKKGSVPMLIWLGKQYLGQQDRQEIMQHGGVMYVVEKIVDVASPDETASSSERADDHLA